MQRPRAREILLACAFVFCACKKHESVVQATATEQPTEPTPVETIAQPAPSASSEPIASVAASASATPDKDAARKAALRDAVEFGMIGLLGDIDAGPTGGGLGTIGTLGDGGGFGTSYGRLSGAPRGSVRMGTLQVNGRLPPELIQRIIRQNFGRFRLCYEDGLRKNPSLQGRVATRFTIDRDGSVKGTPQDAGSDLPDQNVVQCVLRALSNLSYPEPEGGIVTVVAPLLFSPPP